MSRPGFTVTINDRAVVALLDRVRRNTSDLKRATERVAFSISQRVALCFHDERDPWGAPWAPLAATTLRQRRDRGRSGVSILRDTSLLFGSVDATPDGVSVGRADRPAGVHQFGSEAKNIPARPMLPIRNGRVDLPPDWRDEVVAVLHQAIAA